MSRHYVACDFGAESGRVMVGELNRGKLSLTEMHRFPNVPLKDKTSLHWDIPALYQGLLDGLTRASARGDTISGISCDSWGVDYMLFEQDGSLITPTFHYRDPRCPDGLAKVLAKVPWETIYAETGVQQMSFNTLFQLAAENPKRLKRAHHLLSVGDGFNYLLSDVALSEVSMASTTQIYNPVARKWLDSLLRALEIPPSLLPPIVTSGTVLGPLKPELARQTGIDNAQVIASCTHDTAAAVAAMPATGENWAFLSSGTWSLIGMELRSPLISNASRDLNFTNEIGYGHTVRLLKNIVGLWIVQECRRHWAEGEQDLDYEVMTHLAASAPPFESFINPGDPRFMSPGNMPGKVADFCRETGQPVPKKPGAVIRCVLESLALTYRRGVKDLERLTGRKIERLHVVGGGTKNSLLNHFTANALRIPVIIGPAEATATGNILVQALALGHLKSIEEAREVVRHSFKIETIQPPHHFTWGEAIERFDKLIGP